VDAKMMRRTLGLAGAGLVILLGVGQAAGEKSLAPQPGNAATDARPIDALKALAGTWSCEGLARSAAGTPLVFKARFTNKWDLAQSWLVMRYEQTQGKAPTFAAQGFLGWDGAASRFVYLGADSDGGWASVAGAGFAGESLTLSGEGVQGGKKAPLRYTFTRGKSDRDLLVALERQEGTRWSLVTQNTCRR